MTLLNPLALAGFALMIPVILLYMLRLRRREVVVSSTFLWQQVVRDREANTPWQRLRRNLLLFLQLLIIGLLVLALARPAIFVPSIGAGRTTILLDASASMNAQDGEQGTRFDDAVRAARNLIALAYAQTEFSIIRAGTTAEVLTPFTTDRQALTAALEAVQAGQGGADWGTAFTLAAAGAQGSETYSTVIYSDGGGALSHAAELPGKTVYEPVGRSANNLAITALAARALPGQPPQLYAQAENFGPADADAIFSLRLDGELAEARRITIPAQSALPIVTGELPGGFTTAQASLTAPAEAENWPNDLMLDDTAYTVFDDAQTRRILLVSPGGNTYLEQALASLPGVQVVTGSPSSGIPAEGFDLAVLDGWLPDNLPNMDLLILNPPSSTPLFSVGETLERPADGSPGPTGNIQSATDDPRLRFVDLSGMDLRRFRTVSANWAEPLIVADGGPLLLAGETGGRQVAILPFDLRDSSLPLDIAFPILMASLVDWYAPQDLVATPSGNAPGDAIVLNPPPDTRAIRIIPPDGEPVLLELDASGRAVFTGADAPGLYSVEALSGDSVIQSAAFAVNLFNPAESDITPQPSIGIGGETVLPAQGEALGVRELWPLLALAALGLLLLEWLIYFRRQRTPSRFKPVLAPRTPA